MPSLRRVVLNIAVAGLTVGGVFTAGVAIVRPVSVQRFALSTLAGLVFAAAAHAAKTFDVPLRRGGVIGMTLFACVVGAIGVVVRDGLDGQSLFRVMVLWLALAAGVLVLTALNSGTFRTLLAVASSMRCDLFGSNLYADELQPPSFVCLGGDRPRLSDGPCDGMVSPQATDSALGDPCGCRPELVLRTSHSCPGTLSPAPRGGDGRTIRPSSSLQTCGLERHWNVCGDPLGRPVVSAAPAPARPHLGIRRSRGTHLPRAPSIASHLSPVLCPMQSSPCASARGPPRAGDIRPVSHFPSIVVIGRRLESRPCQTLCKRRPLHPNRATRTVGCGCRPYRLERGAGVRSLVGGAEWLGREYRIRRHGAGLAGLGHLEPARIGHLGPW